MPIQIIPIYDNPSILDSQESNLVPSKEMVRFFGLPEDYVQLFVYNNVNTLIGNDPNFQYYSVTENKEINFEPSADIERLGFRLGTYNMFYNFLRPILTLSPDLDLFIKSISSDRKEIKISTTTDNNLFYSNAVAYIDLIQNRNYFIEYYLDFGNNVLVPALSMAVEKDVFGVATVIVKLQDSLLPNITVNTPLNVSEKIVDTQEYQAILTAEQITGSAVLPSLREANFTLDVDSYRIGSSDYYNYNQILNYTGSEFQSLLTFISSSNPTINVDYSNYADFVHFSSISQRLETFQYKLQQIEGLNANIVNFPTSPDKIIYQSQLNSIIQSFDDYENYLYFDSGSTSWPKYPGNKPYVNYSVTSSQGITWYNINQTSASYYDEFNNNNLIYGLPVYIQESPTFPEVAPFVYSMGQMFDEIWLYIKAMTDLWKADNALADGISKDIVGDALQSLGIKLYTDGDQDNIYEWLYGQNSNGTQTFPTQSWQTGVTASLYTMSGQDEAKSIFKRIYANLPTLLKSKGTDRFVNYLNTLYGIPETILFPMEFGGVDKTSNTAEYNYSKFTYALQFQPNKYAYVDTLTGTPYGYNSLEFRFKPTFLNTSSIQTLLVGTDHVTPSQAKWGIILTPTTVNGNSYGTISIIDNVTTSVTLPIFTTGSNQDFNWWNVALINEGTGSVLYVKNELNGEVGFSAVATHPNPIYDTTNTYLEVGNINPMYGTTLPFGYGNGVCYSQIQELRGWTVSLNENTINTHTLNPESYVGNTVDSAYNDLLFRFPLGNDLYTNFGLVTGSQPQQNSDLFLYFNGSWTSNDYVSFTEQYYTQPAVGGYSTPNTDKIRIETQNLATTRLQPFKSVVYNNPTSSRTYDIHLTQVGFSPQDQINNDIIAQLGSTYNLDNVIGDPRQGELNYYPGLSQLQEEYFQKYIGSYNYKDFTQLIETFHKSLFRYLADYVPGRSNNTTGIVYKPHILERSKTRRYEPTISTASYSGQTPVVTITGSNPGDYCCSRNSPLNEAFFDGEFAGSVIPVESYYEQDNPYALFSDQEGTISYPGFDLHVNDNWNIYLPSAGTWELEIGVQHLGEELYITDLTSLTSLGGLNMGPAGVYTLTITTTGTGIEFSNQGLWGMGYISIAYVKAIEVSSLPKFTAQYGGYDALNNNVMNGLISQYKFKHLSTSQSINTSSLGNCVRYKVWNLGSQGGTPAQQADTAYFAYADCDTGTTSLCNTVDSTPFPSYNENFVYVNAIEGSVIHIDGTLPICGPGPYAPLNNFKVDFDAYIRLIDTRLFNYLTGSYEWQDSLVTDSGYVQSRETGVKTTSPDFNEPMVSGSTIGNIPNVEQTTGYMLYYDWTANALAERFGSFNYHIKYLIDDTGSVYKPTYNSSFYYNTDQAFGADTPVDITIYDVVNQNTQTANETTVYRALKQFEPILYTDTGSQGNNYLVSGSMSSIILSSSNAANADFGLFVAKSGSALTGKQTILTGTSSIVTFNSESYDKAEGWNLNTNVYTCPFTTTIRATISCSMYIENTSNTGGTQVTASLYKNGVVIDQDRISLTASPGVGSARVFKLEARDSFTIGDTYYVEVISKSRNIQIWSNAGGLTWFNIIPFTGGVSISKNNMWSTGATNDIVLTGSIDLAQNYGYVEKQYNLGFNDCLPFIIQPYDQFRFEGNENKVYTVMSVVVNLNSLYVTLDKPINKNNTDINYFLIRRLVNNPGFIMLNSSGSGNGFIIPKYPTPTLKNNLPNIIADLSSKGLIP